MFFRSFRTTSCITFFAPICGGFFPTPLGTIVSHFRHCFGTHCGHNTGPPIRGHGGINIIVSSNSGTEVTTSFVAGALHRTFTILGNRIYTECCVPGASLKVCAFGLARLERFVRRLRSWTCVLYVVSYCVSFFNTNRTYYFNELYPHFYFPQVKFTILFTQQFVVYWGLVCCCLLVGRVYCTVVTLVVVRRCDWVVVLNVSPNCTVIN